MPETGLTERNRDWVWLVLIVSAGCSLRLAAILTYSHPLESDEIAYQAMALNIVSGNGILENGNRAFYNAGYSMFVLAPVFYLFGYSLLAARLANLVIGAVAILLCYFVAKQAGAGRIGRLLAAGIWALYLPTGVYAVYLAKENLMVPLMLGVLWCALRLTYVPSSKVSIGCGALLGLLALTGNAALSLVGIVMFALIVAPAGPRQRMALFVLVLAGGSLAATPWLLRNYYVLGAPVLNTNGGFNLYLGNNPAATGFFVSITDTPRGPSWQELRSTGELQASGALREEAISWITEHPMDFTALAIKKAILFWTPPFHDGKDGNASKTESLVRAVWVVQFLAMMLAASISPFLAKLRNAQLLTLGLAVLFYTAVHMLFYVIFRYREPIMPIIGVMSALAVETLVLARLPKTFPDMSS